MSLVFILIVTTALIFIIEKQNEPKTTKADKNKTKRTGLSREQAALADLIETSYHHIFITGKAGSGKSYLLKYFKDHTSKKIVILAPTGVAALNVGGQTIHSFFKLTPNLDNKDLAMRANTLALLKNIEAIVIDEVSMVRADLMDLIDHKLRHARNSNQAFGGIQIILFGDLYQLPPVVESSEVYRFLSTTHNGYFFFNAHVWNKTKLYVYELNEIYRQRSDTFKTILNEVRSGQISQRSLSVLNKRAKVKMPGEGLIILAGTNKLVNEINHQKLKRLKSPLYIYKSSVSGRAKGSETIAEKSLSLKVGAQIIMTNNDKNKRWVNGSLGKIESLNSYTVKVRINNKIHQVDKINWSIMEYKYSPKFSQIEKSLAGTITQYPIRLAWAITIHKSQGQTYSACAIDLKEGVFASGQAYVALSRCRSLNGLYLLSPIMPSDITASKEVINFMKKRARTIEIN